MTTPSTSGFQVAPGAPQLYDRYVAPVMRDCVAALVGATVGQGSRVLDVACGTGFAARAAAVASEPGGAVAAIDINPSMVEYAATVPSRVPGIEWRVGSALDLPYPDESFDCVLCNHGLQFFPDPPAGLAEMVRVSTPDGAVAATVWGPLDSCPYFEAQKGLLVEHVGMSPTVFDQAFPPSGESGLLAWAEAAGLEQVTIVSLDFEIQLPPLRDYIPAHLTALPWSAGFVDLPEARRNVATQEMIDRLEAFVASDGTASVPTRALMLSCRPGGVAGSVQ